MAQQVENLALSLLWLRLLLWRRFNPWPRNFCMPRVQSKNKRVFIYQNVGAAKKKKKSYTYTSKNVLNIYTKISPFI